LRNSNQKYNKKWKYKKLKIENENEKSVKYFLKNEKNTNWK